MAKKHLLDQLPELFEGVPTLHIDRHFYFDKEAIDLIYSMNIHFKDHTVLSKAFK